jgi:hypothetical protein
VSVAIALADALLRLSDEDRWSLRGALLEDQGHLQPVWLQLAALIDEVIVAEEVRGLNAAIDGTEVPRSVMLVALAISAAPVFVALDALPIGNVALATALALAEGDAPMRDVWMALVGHVLGVT